MRLYLVHRPDGVRSKPVSRQRILDMYSVGKLQDSWIVTDDACNNSQTVAEFIGESEFLSHNSKQAKKANPPRPKQKRGRSEGENKVQSNLPTLRPSDYDSSPPFDVSSGELTPEDPISARAFIDFTKHLPERDVAVHLEGDATQTMLKHSSVIQLATIHPSSPWISYERGNERFVLRKAIKRDGWLCVHFGYFYDALVTSLLRYPQLKLDSQTVQSLYEATNRFAAKLQAGLTSEDVREALTAILVLDGNADLLNADYTMTKALLSGPIQVLQDLTKTWAMLAPLNCPRISPIGLPSIKATFKGLVVSSLFNSAFSFVDSMIVDSQSRALNCEIQKASRMILLARAVCVERLRS